jgi:four helix bundle protein
VQRRTRAFLASQLERAAVSIPANIAEGYGRSSRGEYLQFLSFAAASLREVETLTLIAKRNGLARNESVTEVLPLADETGRVLHGLRKSLRRTADSAQKWPN